MFADYEAPLNDVYLFGVFRLTFPLMHLATALGAHLVWLIQIVLFFDHWQTWLRTTSVAFLDARLWGFVCNW